MTRTPTPPEDELLLTYLADRAAHRAEAATAWLGSLTDYERGLVHDAAVMGYVQGLMRDRSEGVRKDSQVMALVIEACQAMPDLYPAVAVERAHPVVTGWVVETPLRGTWRRTGPVFDDPERAAQRYRSAVEQDPAREWRVVRVTTSQTVAASHDPDAEGPAAHHEAAHGGTPTAEWNRP
ncbi:hypothetical protein [Streptomyces sp. C10-9-1]|uniref:hypothetical protein n=1 Tax=Streptomyces sp. C10-9-1 TaxID=1859285 RepID=UPI003F49C022